MKKAFIYDNLGFPNKRECKAKRVLLPSIPNRIVLATKDRYCNWTIFDALSGAVIINQDSTQADLDCVIADADYRIKKWIPKDKTLEELVKTMVFDKGIKPIPENIANFS